jgi:hypothetical protein
MKAVSKDRLKLCEGSIQLQFGALGGVAKNAWDFMIRVLWQEPLATDFKGVIQREI